MCLYLLRFQGYDVHMLGEYEKNKDRENLKEDIDLIEAYENIQEITREEIDTLKRNTENTGEDKLRMDKYYFESITIQELPTLLKSTLFFDYYQNAFKKKNIEHVRLEKSNMTNNEMIDYELRKNQHMIEKIHMTNSKLIHLKEFNAMLGLKNSCENKVTIDRIKMTGEIKKYVKKHRKELSTIYSSKLEFKNDKSDNFVIFKFMQKVYNDWSSLKFKAHTKNRMNITEKYITEAIDIYNTVQPIKHNIVADNMLFNMGYEDEE